MRILLTIQYDGKNFCGWQVQPKNRSVQGELETAISNLLSEKISLFASGRTDSGVSAFAQTAHFDTITNFDIKKLAKAINSSLPHDVAVLSAKKVKNDFHARFAVKKKTYLYKCYASEIPLPLFEATNLKISKKVFENFEEMKKASKRFLGEHDFSAFCSSNSSVKDFTRTIFDIKIKKTKNEILFFVSGNGFLYNMVRIIVGTLLAVGEGKIKESEIPNIINSKNRKLAGKTVSAKGLYLWEVKY